jgi:hypothetical protein
VCHHARSGSVAVWRQAAKKHLPSTACDKHGGNVTALRRGQEVENQSENKNENDNENGWSKGPTNGRISAKQHQYAVSLGQQNRGMTKKELDDHCVGIYGAGVDFISRKDASALINALRSEQVSVSQAKIATK